MLNFSASLKYKIVFHLFLCYNLLKVCNISSLNIECFSPSCRFSSVGTFRFEFGTFVIYFFRCLFIFCYFFVFSCRLSVWLILTFLPLSSFLCVHKNEIHQLYVTEAKSVKTKLSINIHSTKSMQTKW